MLSDNCLTFGSESPLTPEALETDIKGFVAEAKKMGILPNDIHLWFHHGYDPVADRNNWSLSIAKLDKERPCPPTTPAPAAGGRNSHEEANHQPH